jgi:hypothetical protein
MFSNDFLEKLLDYRFDLPLAIGEGLSVFERSGLPRIVGNLLSSLLVLLLLKLSSSYFEIVVL